MPKHITTIQEWRELDPDEDPDFTISQDLLRVFAKNGWVDSLDLYVLSYHMV